MKAMWLWREADPEDVITWCRMHQVDHIFVYYPTLTPDWAWYMRLAIHGESYGITTAALNGDAGWLTDVGAAVSWMNAAQNSGVFDALHCDIEPYSLDAWATDRDTTAQQYLDLLDVLASGPLPLEIEVPFWYGTVVLGDGRNLADEVLARVAHVTVMAYRNTVAGPNSIMDVALDMLTRAPGSATVRLGVETQPLTSCTYCTFYGSGLTALADGLTQVEALGAAYPCFAGVAVHHYHSWTTLSL